MGDVRTFPKKGTRSIQKIDRSPYEVVVEHMNFVNAVCRLRNGPSVDHIRRLRSMGDNVARIAETYLLLFGDDLK